MGKKASVRLMAPFSMHCTSCGHFIYKSTKFNARKTSTGEQYLGIAIVQFSIRCPSCSNEIRFRTDPKTSGFIVLTGADRNLEPWHNKAAEQESTEGKLARLTAQAEDQPSAAGLTTDEYAEHSSKSQRKQADSEDAKRLLKEEVRIPKHDPNDRVPTTLPHQQPARVVKLPTPKRRKHLGKS